MGYRDAMIHGETNVGLGMVGGDSEEDRLIEENRDLRTRLEQAERQRDEARAQIGRAIICLRDATHDRRCEVADELDVLLRGDRK